VRRADGGCRRRAVGFAAVAFSLAAASPAVAEPSVEDQGPERVFLGTAAESPLPPPETAGPTPSGERTARAYLDELASEVGLDASRAELRILDAAQPAEPGAVVRFQQYHDGVPVLAGELVTRLDGRGRLLSLSGEILPVDELESEPRIAAARSPAPRAFR
jgi:Zn-dependent metalloprotease